MDLPEGDLMTSRQTKFLGKTCLFIVFFALFAKFTAYLSVVVALYLAYRVMK